jgi:hypothetical protein
MVKAKDIKRKYRLLKVCYVPATSTAFLVFFSLLLLWPLTLLIRQTRQAVRAINQSIFLDVYGKDNIGVEDTIVVFISMVTLKVLKVSIHRQFGSSNFDERCNFNRRFPIISKSSSTAKATSIYHFHTCVNTALFIF